MNGPSPVRPQWQLSRLLLGFAEVREDQDRMLAGLRLDSRQTVSGDLFCALAGTRTHGLEFAAGAVERGAAAVLAEPGGAWTSPRIVDLADALGVPVIEVAALSARLSAIAGRFYGEPGRGLDVIAVTGTNGKTSVCQFIAQALDGERPCAVIGTLGYGFPGALTPTAHTTPDAIRLQQIQSELKGRGAAAVAMEVSSHALDQGRAAGIAVDTAVFTNLTRDHLDYHADMPGYAQAKRRLFHHPGLRHAVLNADDPFGLDILGSLDPEVKAVLYGLEPTWRSRVGERPWLRAELLEPRARGMEMRITGSWGDGAMSTALLGRFNASNLLAVAAVLLLRGWDLPSVLSRLSGVRGVPGRMECFGRPGQPLVVVDYAHTPDALEQALSVLREYRPRRLITLFGCGGDRDRGKRPEMGAVAERLSDLVILTDDNPRGEDGDRIVEEILAGMKAPEKSQVQRGRGRAIRYGVCVAGPEDILLVAGKGHETTQKVGDQELPFSDRAQVTQALNERGGCTQ